MNLPNLRNRVTLRRSSLLAQVRTGSLSFHTSENAYAKELMERMTGFVASKFGDSSVASWRKLFDLHAYPGDCNRPDGVCTGPYWIKEDLASLLNEADACAPADSGDALRGIGDCQKTAQAILEHFDKDGDSRLTWEEFRDGLKLKEEFLFLPEIANPVVEAPPPAPSPPGVPSGIKYTRLSRQPLSNVEMKPKSSPWVYVAAGGAGALLLWWLL